MGQYWKPVNLDKREFIDPHKLGAGLKLWEQLTAHPGTGAALIILCAAQREPRGGGDLDMNDNWHGAERVFPQHNTTPGPMPIAYPELAGSIIGRWAGDRIALVGDYARDGDLAPEHQASKIYDATYEDDSEDDEDPEALPKYTDITDLVARVIEHELQGVFMGDGWKDFVPVSS